MQLITRELTAAVTEKARQSPRRRMNHNFHASMEDNPHRFLNVLLEGTYVRPHRHLDPPKPEAFLVIEGRALLVLFDAEGTVTRRITLGPGADCDAIGIDLDAGVWHTILAASPVAVCYEVKPGPYTAASDKDFAAWAPREGTPEAAALVERLLAGGGVIS